MDNRTDKTYSRRQILAGLGAVAAGSLLCGSVGVTGLWLSQRDADPDSTATPEALLSAATATADIPVPDIVPRDVWGALPPNHNAPNETGYYSALNPAGWRIYEDELHTVYNTVVIHHSVLYTLNDAVTLLDIQRLHRNDRGWADVAYHYFVGRNGQLYQGREIGVRGVHVGGYNTGSLGVCLTGNFEDETPSPLQLNSLQRLLDYVTQRLQLTHLAIHRDFNPETRCPGQNLIDIADAIAQQAGLIRGTEGYVPPSASAGSCSCCDDDCAT